MTAFDDAADQADDGLFFAGISAEDEDEPEVEEEEDATLADTRVRTDEEPSGAASMPMLGMGAGAGGAAAVGAYAGQSRADHERSRSGVSGAAPVGAPVGALDDQSGLGVDAYGRIVQDDPWGVDGEDDVPDAIHSDTAATEAPRARSGGGTRGSYLARNESGTAPGGAIPGATLGGIGGTQQAQGVAAQTASSTGAQSGGIPLSVLQNLQSNRSGAAFAPMTGVQASGSQGYLADPSLVVAQAFGSVGGEGIDGVPGEQWLRDRLREHELRGGNAPVAGVEVPRDGSEDAGGGDEDDEREPSKRRSGRDAGPAAAGGVAAVPWGGGSSTSSNAPGTAPGAHHGGAGTTHQGGTGWNPNSGPNASSGHTGVQAAGTSRESGTTPAQEPDHAPLSSSGGTPVGFSDGGGLGGWQAGRGRQGHDGPGRNPGGLGEILAPGSDFRVASEELARDADRWRRLALEMEGIGAVTGMVRDGHSSFGLVSEPAAAYSRATHQHQRWAAQAVQAYEQLAAQLQATAAGYDATEQAAVHGTGKVFDA